MKKKYDILLNVILPVCAGAACYFYQAAWLPSWTRWYVPDALWAYAFTSTILIIWDRAIQPVWMVFVGLSFILFEAAQSAHFINGTADAADMVVYVLAATAALVLNGVLQSNTFETINKRRLV